MTDFELNQLGDGVDLVIKPPAEALEQMDDFVRDMHTTSGLLDELDRRHRPWTRPRSRCSPTSASGCPEPRKAPLGGNTVGTDRGFLARDMPELEAHLHYRIIDVSSIKELSRRWYPRAYFNSPKKAGGHRALADIRGVDRRAALLPRGRLRAAARPRHRHRRARSPPGTSIDGLTAAARRMPCSADRGGHEHPSGAGTIGAADSATGCDDRSCRHGGCSSAGRALRCGRGCRGFKSRHSPHEKVGRASARGHGPHPFPAAWASALAVGWVKPRHGLHSELRGLR